MSYPAARAQQVVTFARIGRNHTVPPLVTAAAGADAMAEEILRYARPHLLSRDVSVVFEADERSGWIFCGARNGGTFTIAPLLDDVAPLAETIGELHDRVVDAGGKLTAYGFDLEVRTPRGGEPA